ncbi:MAG: glycosyltransferase family 2 protein [Planctomycetota bacterium]|jgi:glycosyltransferase involved in cell wall biosynthesis
MQPLVSAIIPTYNSAQYIKEALDSVFNQTYKNIEVIVVDDGSTDDTREVLKPCLDKIRYIYKENSGPASARNLGIKNAQGEYIAFLDADDAWISDKTNSQIREMSSGLGLVGSSSKEIKDLTPSTRRIIYFNLLIKNAFANSGVMVRRNCFEKVGFFDERPEFKAVEDWDMWLRIVKFYDIKFLDKPLVKIRVRKDGISAPANAETMLRNELKVLNKAFSDQSLKRKWVLKRKAYGYRYYSAAIAYKETGETKKARECLLRSFYLFPFSFFNKPHLSLAVYAIFGNRGFKKMKRVVNYFWRSPRYNNVR